VIEKTITIFRNKKPKKPKIWTFGFFFGFFKNLKNLGFFKSDFYSPGIQQQLNTGCISYQVIRASAAFLLQATSLVELFNATSRSSVDDH